MRHPELPSALARAAAVSGSSAGRGRDGGCLHRHLRSPPCLTCFVYPGAVPVQLALNLLLPPQFHERSPVLHSLSLFGKFPVDEKDESQE